VIVLLGVKMRASLQSNEFAPGAGKRHTVERRSMLLYAEAGHRDGAEIATRRRPVHAVYVTVGLRCPVAPCVPYQQ